MKQIKLFTLFLTLIIGGILLHSCSNSNSRKGSEVVEYQPDILDSDRVIKCYHLSGTPEDILQGVHRAMSFGNILISQNGIIKAVQMQYSDGKILWHEIAYMSINDGYRQFKCEITGKTFNNCADIVYKDKDLEGLEYDKNIRLFWN